MYQHLQILICWNILKVSAKKVYLKYIFLIKRHLEETVTRKLRIWRICHSKFWSTKMFWRFISKLVLVRLPVLLYYGTDVLSDTNYRFVCFNFTLKIVYQPIFFWRWYIRKHLGIVAWQVSRIVNYFFYCLKQ